MFVVVVVVLCCCGCGGVLLMWFLLLLCAVDVLSLWHLPLRMSNVTLTSCVKLSDDRLDFARMIVGSVKKMVVDSLTTVLVRYAILFIHFILRPYVVG